MPAVRSRTAGAPQSGVPATDVVDYALARRAVLTELAAGRTAQSEVCDAHPYLLRAARHHGVLSEVRCPVCRREPLRYVTYAYGEELGPASGRARGPHEIAALSTVPGQVHVYVVEVCCSCSWNHLVTSYLTGSVVTRSGRSR